jgi:hypothetical protein
MASGWQPLPTAAAPWTWALVYVEGMYLHDLRQSLGIHMRPNWSPDSSFLTFEYMRPLQPPDIYRLDLNKDPTGKINAGNLVQLTFSNLPALENLSLVIPLGFGYDWRQLAGWLGNPQQIGRLPPIPFGWKVSSLPVRDALLTNLLDNLLGSLREDGFTQVFRLVPPGLDLKLKKPSKLLEIAPLFEQAAAVSFPSEPDLHKVVLVPIGHTEQHGLHLPLCTDMIIYCPKAPLKNWMMRVSYSSGQAWKYPPCPTPGTTHICLGCRAAANWS